MRCAKIENGVAVIVTEGNDILAGYIQAPAGADVGWSYKDGKWAEGAQPKSLKIHYTHREFILRLGEDYSKIERLRDENNAKPPAEKNYELARLFRLFDLSEWIGLDDPALQQAMQAFVGLGLITQERAEEIMTPNEVG